ncbi:MAG: hypothetical protein H6737_23630 [Alphaproteobacteria bacterium]|nr:hypothetical protein [Alphaproteobacteria bacterium]
MKKPALVVSALFATLAGLAVVGAAAVYVFAVRPLRTLPRPIDAIQADWAAVEAGPPLPLAQPEDPAMLALVDRALGEVPDPAGLAAWLLAHRIPEAGCTMPTALAGDAGPEVSTMRWFEVGRTLVPAHPDAASALAMQLHDRELLGLMVGKALLDELGEPLAPEAVLEGLEREVRCADATLALLIEGDPANGADVLPSAWPVDLERERWVYRDHAARIVLALRATSPDRDAMRSALEPFRDGVGNAPVARLLTSGLSVAVGQALEVPPPRPMAPPEPEASADAEGEPAPPTESAPPEHEPRCEARGNGFTLDRAVLGSDAVARAGRLVPHRSSDGELDGFRMSGLRESGLGQSCGFRNGDVLRAVNGLPLRTVEDAMNAYGAVSEGSEAQIEVLRDGAPVVFTVTLR